MTWHKSFQHASEQFRIEIIAAMLPVGKDKFNFVVRVSNCWSEYKMVLEVTADMDHTSVVLAQNELEPFCQQVGDSIHSAIRVTTCLISMFPLHCQSLLASWHLVSH